VNNCGRIDIKFLAGIGISLFFMVLLFRKIDFAQLLSTLKSLDWRYLLAAVFITFFSYSLRAVRWHYLILPLKKAAPRNLLAATIICYMANNLLPARLGEFIRAYMLAEKENLEASSVFATLVVDRLFDGFSVLIILLVTFFTVQLPPGMENVQRGMVTGGYVTFGLYVTVIIFLVFLKRRTAATLSITSKILKPLPAKISGKVIPLLGSFISGIRLTSKPKELFALVFSSALIWGTAVWPVDLLLRAFRIDLPIAASMFILVFLVFAVMVPASPGYIGTYHAACVYGLMAFNVPKELALSVAIVMHSLNFFPVIIIGFLFLWKDGVSFSSLGKYKSA
jgi:glycosyltransferase 2 family protein